jgi:hypothetical protein
MYRHNLTQGLFEKSKLDQQARGHQICWEDSKVLHTEPNTTYRKYKELAYMSLAAHLLSRPTLESSPIWILPPLRQGYTKEIGNCNATATSEKRHQFQAGNWFPD